MKRNIIFSILLFAVILITVFAYLDKVFASSHYYVNTSEDFKTLASKTNIDVIFYGSSHAYTAFNPLIINKKCKTISYNLASDALLLSITDLVLDESLKYTKPKLIILEVYKATFANPVTKSQKGYQLRGLDFVSNYSIKKLNRVRDLYNTNEYLGVFSPLIRNHSDWHDRNFFKLSKKIINSKKDKEFYYNGYIGYKGEIKEKKKYKGFQNISINKDSTIRSLNPYSIKLLDNFLKIAEDNNIQVLLIYAPDVRVRSWNYFFFDELKEIADYRNINFLNLNDYFSEMKLEVEDFRDPSHLNVYGSIKATNFLSEYLNENYDLSNRTDTYSYKESMKVFEKFENDYYSLQPSFFQGIVNQNLVNDFAIDDIRIDKSKKDKLSLKINFSGQTTAPKELKNYRLAIHCYPKKEDIYKLSKKSKARKILFDIKDYLFETNNNYIEIEFNSKLTNLDALELFLYDKEGFNGVIGSKVRINNIVLKPIE